MLHVFEHAILDSLKVLAIVLVVYFIIGLLEGKISHKIQHMGKWSPLVGVCFGLIPQCGFSVIAADMYNKKHITAGTVIGVFIATSDEALPILLSNPDKILSILPLLGIKLVVGLAMGYAVDLIYKKGREEVALHKDECGCEEVVHVGCCGHEIEVAEEIADCNEKHRKAEGPYKEIHSAKSTHHHSRYQHHHHEDEGEEGEHHHEEEEKEEKKKFRFNKVWCKKYLLHPLIHSLKIFLYVFAINMIFGTIMHFAEDQVVALLRSGRYITPLLSVVVGLIPNCASSVILANLYVSGVLSFGACVGGLCANAGLGLLILYKNVKETKRNLIITAILILTAIGVGYASCGIFGF